MGKVLNGENNKTSIVNVRLIIVVQHRYTVRVVYR